MAITTGKSALRPVVTAVHAAMSADATLGALATSYGTDVPQNPTYPYTTVEAFEIPEDLMGRQGSEVTLRVHVFTDQGAYRGDGKAFDIIDRLKALLRLTALVVTGYELRAIDFLQAQRVTDEEVAGKKVRHHVAEFRADVLEVL